MRKLSITLILSTLMPSESPPSTVPLLFLSQLPAQRACSLQFAARPALGTMDPDAETVEPPSIKCGTVPFDINFHPSQDVIAVGMISGAVKMYVVSVCTVYCVSGIQTHVCAVVPTPSDPAVWACVECTATNTRRRVTRCSTTHRPTSSHAVPSSSMPMAPVRTCVSLPMLLLVCRRRDARLDAGFLCSAVHGGRRSRVAEL